MLPIHNLGYRAWQGTLGAFGTRWIVVAEIGIRRAWQSIWLRRILVFAWMPAAMMGFLIFLYERSAEDGGPSPRMFQELSRMLLRGGTEDPSLSDLFTPNAVFQSKESLAENRHQFWSMLLLALFDRSQAFLMIPIVGLISPPLISQDVRSRAFLLYFSRPLSRTQYILGKAAVVMFYTSLVTLVPGLLLYTVGVLLSPSLSIVLYTWDIPLRVVAVSAAVTIPCTFLSLMFSSLTTESRFASFAWFSVWIFGFATYVAVMGPLSGSGSSVLIQCVSLFHLLRDVGSWILDVKTDVSDIQTRMAVLIALTCISAATLYRRVSAPMQI